ncbi:hypothetical protein MLD38_008713 [Melastoma candidum]|uniref:Uncharacterized protein n=1 Tax=Melastoma candidum TaxID=119954 RepID=A0ACB9RV75_9MYRT|nr:hypothetical protein MLD38_008713 [Melastoma candidum]
MVMAFSDLASASGLKKLDDYLSTRSYITGDQWYHRVEALLRISAISGESTAVTVKGLLMSRLLPIRRLLLSLLIDYHNETTAKASSKKKDSGKSSILLDVKPWDDETDMKKLEEAVRSIRMEGLLWGESKLVAAGYGIKKLQIMLTIVDDLVSVSALIEDHLTAEPINEYVQSCEILSFNKISSHPRRKRRNRKKKSASHP